MSVILLDLLTKSVAGVICEFCKKDFVTNISLETHTWCCKARVAQIDEKIQINYQPLPPSATVITQNDNGVK